MQRAQRKNVFVLTHRIRTASDLLGGYGKHEMFRVDTSAITDDAALAHAAAMADWIIDCGDIWDGQDLQRPRLWPDYAGTTLPANDGVGLDLPLVVNEPIVLVAKVAVDHVQQRLDLAV